MNFFAAILTAGLFTLSASSAVSQSATGSPPSGTAVEAPIPPAAHIPPPPAGKSQVVFFRTGAYAGAATWFKVRENGAELGKLSNQSYFVAVLPPGPHTFTAATENQTKLKLELDDGETYYVRGTLQMGILMAEPNLAPADQVLFEKHFSHMHLTTLAPADASAPTDKPAS